MIHNGSQWESHRRTGCPGVRQRQVMLRQVSGTKLQVTGWLGAGPQYAQGWELVDGSGVGGLSQGDIRTLQWPEVFSPGATPHRGTLGRRHLETLGTLDSLGTHWEWWLNFRHHIMKPVEIAPRNEPPGQCHASQNSLLGQFSSQRLHWYLPYQMMVCRAYDNLSDLKTSRWTMEQPASY